ncbi:hypothetical protein H3U18_19530, partial [Clostridioides difficile]|nr:hypothetical protein [Clostridioides difficile]
SETENGLLYGRLAELAKINARTDFDKYIDHMIYLLKVYSDITHIYIEKNTFNGADANQLEFKIKNDNVLSYRDIEIINEQQKKNKDDKIPVLNKGQMIFAEEDKEFIQQILDFTGQKYSLHDDAPDISSEFINRINNIKVSETVNIFDRKLLGF